MIILIELFLYKLRVDDFKPIFFWNKGDVKKTYNFLQWNLTLTAIKNRNDNVGDPDMIADSYQSVY